MGASPYGSQWKNYRQRKPAKSALRHLTAGIKEARRQHEQRLEALKKGTAHQLHLTRVMMTGANAAGDEYDDDEADDDDSDNDY